MHTLFKASRIVMKPATDASRARIPALKKRENGKTVDIVENKEKSKVVFEKFFRRPVKRKYPTSTQVPEARFQVTINH